MLLLPLVKMSNYENIYNLTILHNHEVEKIQTKSSFGEGFLKGRENGEE